MVDMRATPALPHIDDVLRIIGKIQAFDPQANIAAHINRAPSGPLVSFLQGARMAMSACSSFAKVAVEPQAAPPPSIADITLLAVTRYLERTPRYRRAALPYSKGADAAGRQHDPPCGIAASLSHLIKEECACNL